MAENNTTHVSGTTTPEDTRSLATTDRDREDDEETLVSTQSTSSTTTSIAPPAPPVNSPTTQSVAGEMASLNLSSANAALASSTTATAEEGEISEGGSGSITPPGEHVHENSVWQSVALDDISRGLKRLATAAEDLHRIDDSKSVGEWYSEALAEAIKNGPVEFESKFLE